MNGLTSNSRGAKGAAGPGATETQLRTLVDTAKAELDRGKTNSKDHLRLFMTRLLPKGPVASLTGQNSMKSYLKTISPNELMAIVDNYDTLKEAVSLRVDTSSRKESLTQALCKALLEGCALSLLGGLEDCDISEIGNEDKNDFLESIRAEMTKRPPIRLQNFSSTGREIRTFADLQMTDIKDSKLFKEIVSTVKGSPDFSGVHENPLLAASEHADSGATGERMAAETLPVKSLEAATTTIRIDTALRAQALPKETLSAKKVQIGKSGFYIKKNTLTHTLLDVPKSSDKADPASITAQIDELTTLLDKFSDKAYADIFELLGLEGTKHFNDVAQVEAQLKEHLGALEAKLTGKPKASEASGSWTFTNKRLANDAAKLAAERQFQLHSMPTSEVTASGGGARADGGGGNEDEDMRNATAASIATAEIAEAKELSKALADVAKLQFETAIDRRSQTPSPTSVAKMARYRPTDMVASDETIRLISEQQSGVVPTDATGNCCVDALFAARSENGRLRANPETRGLVFQAISDGVRAHRSDDSPLVRKFIITGISSLRDLNTHQTALNKVFTALDKAGITFDQLDTKIRTLTARPNGGARPATDRDGALIKIIKDQRAEMHDLKLDTMDSVISAAQAVSANADSLALIPDDKQTLDTFLALNDAKTALTTAGLKTDDYVDIRFYESLRTGLGQASMDTLLQASTNPVDSFIELKKQITSDTFIDSFKSIYSKKEHYLSPEIAFLMADVGETELTIVANGESLDSKSQFNKLLELWGIPEGTLPLSTSSDGTQRQTAKLRLTNSHFERYLPRSTRL
jgi:hypothetical protein